MPRAFVGKGKTGPVPNPVTLDPAGLFQAKFVSVGDDMFIGGQPMATALSQTRQVNLMDEMRMSQQQPLEGFLGHAVPEIAHPQP